MKHVICYSGGHSSALVAIEVARKFGTENLILLNHDLSSSVECADVKRFKKQVADYLGVAITFANIDGITDPDLIPDQFDVCVKAKAFKVRNGQELCTNRLKTGPFMDWLAANSEPWDAIIYYGFDANEQHRITRRSTIMGSMGWQTDYPLALWKNRTIAATTDIGIDPPMQYGQFKHANCVGCLKAGKQHWYVTYCERPDVYEKAKRAEESIGYSILREDTLEELEPVFAEMKAKGIPVTERIQQQTFWASVRKAGIDTSTDENRIPCECIF